MKLLQRSHETRSKNLSAFKAAQCRAMLGNLGQCGAIWDNAGQYGAMWSNAGQCRPIQGNADQYRAIQGNAGRYRAIQGNAEKRRVMQGIAGHWQYRAIQGIAGATNIWYFIIPFYYFAGDLANKPQQLAGYVGRGEPYLI